MPLGQTDNNVELVMQVNVTLFAAASTDYGGVHILEPTVKKTAYAPKLAISKKNQLKYHFISAQLTLSSYRNEICDSKSDYAKLSSASKKVTEFNVGNLPTEL